MNCLIEGTFVDLRMNPRLFCRPVYESGPLSFLREIAQTPPTALHVLVNHIPDEIHHIVARVSELRWQDVLRGR